MISYGLGADARPSSPYTGASETMSVITRTRTIASRHPNMSDQENQFLATFEEKPSRLFYLSRALKKADPEKVGCIKIDEIVNLM